MKSYLEL